MALLSDLVAICANQRLDSEATLNLFARRLREAGRVSKAGRGRGAAKMTHLDAARFLIACAATDHPERVADAEAVFSGTRMTDREISRPGEVRAERGDRTTLDEGLAAVLQRLAEGSFDANAIVDLDVSRSGVTARLRAGNEQFVYLHPALAKMTDAPSHDLMTILEKSYEEETERFRSGKNLRANLSGALLRAVAVAIAGSGAAK